MGLSGDHGRLIKWHQPDNFAFVERSGTMKAPVGLLSDRTVLRSKMEGPRPDKFAFAKRSAAMKAPVGLLSGRAVCVSRWRGFAPTSSAERSKRYFHGRGRRGKRHLQRRFLRKRSAAGGRSLPLGGAVAQRLRGFKSAEPEKTVKRSSRRTGVNLQFFPV